MSDSCDLTQYTISKGGTTCVFGTCQGGSNWSSLAMDYLVVNLLLCQRYRKVICLNFESRNLMSSIANQVEIMNKRNKITDKSKAIPDWKDTLCVIDAEYSEAQNKYQISGRNQASTLTPASEDIWSDVLSEIHNTTNKKGLNNEMPFGNIAVVVYSLSELVLNVGFADTRSFIRRLSNQLQQLPTNRSITEGTDTTSPPPSPIPLATTTTAAQTPCVLLAVYESLHPVAVTAQIQTLATVLVRVVPNSGTLSDTVAAEIQTVRRSAATGKISESVEMFSCGDGLLQPVKPTNPAGKSAGSEASAEDELSASVANMTLPSREQGDKKTSAADSVAAAVAQKTAANTRLITFDSTDPEFDEDSDPDADLDL